MTARMTATTGFLKKSMPPLYNALGVYLPLITTLGQNGVGVDQRVVDTELQLVCHSVALDGNADAQTHIVS